MCNPTYGCGIKRKFEEFPDTVKTVNGSLMCYSCLIKKNREADLKNKVVERGFKRCDERRGCGLLKCISNYEDTNTKNGALICLACNIKRSRDYDIVKENKKAHKVCNKAYGCGRNLLLTSFGPMGEDPYGQRLCKECYKDAYVEGELEDILNYIMDEEEELLRRTKPDPEATWEARMFHKYKLTSEDYFGLIMKQNYSCAVCFTPEWELKKHNGESSNNYPTEFKSPKLVIDHSHENIEVRGLLCNVCNLALGAFSDSPIKLRSAAEYLNALWPLPTYQHTGPPRKDCEACQKVIGHLGVIQSGGDESVKRWNKDLKHIYGITALDYVHILGDQNMLCAICRKPASIAKPAGGHYREIKALPGLERTLVVDHDHATGVVRGLICRECNWGLGYVKDSSKILYQAARYLEEYNARAFKSSSRIP